MLPANRFVALQHGRLLVHAPTLDGLLEALRRDQVDERRVVIEYVAPQPDRRRVF